MDLVLATTNKGKVEEFQKLLQQLPVTIKTLADFPYIGNIEESGTTFAENALLKAKTVAAATGQLTLADDSGLEVDYLNGAPGVYSARYAGEEKNDEANIDKLLTALDGVAEKERTACFRCAIAIVDKNGTAYQTEGICRGLIAAQRVGSGGFGYDPIFIVPQLKKTFAQLSATEKNRISHRGLANQEAVKIISSIIEGENNENCNR